MGDGGKRWWFKWLRMVMGGLKWVTVKIGGDSMGDNGNR